MEKKLDHYVEVLFRGPLSWRGCQIFPCSKSEMTLVAKNVTGIEDHEATSFVWATFFAVIQRNPVLLTEGDRQAEYDLGKLVSLEYR